MKKYILSRIIRSIFSIIVVESIVITMIYTMIPKTKVLDQDTGYRKMTGDSKTVYRLSRYQELGYLDFDRLTDMCSSKSDNYEGCMVNGSDENKRVIEEYEKSGYTIDYLKNGAAYATFLTEIIVSAISFVYIYLRVFWRKRRCMGL